MFLLLLVSQVTDWLLCQQVSPPDADQANGGGAGEGASELGSLPSSGPLPPHLVIKKEKGLIFLQGWTFHPGVALLSVLNTCLVLVCPGPGSGLLMYCHVCWYTKTRAVAGQ